jgi:hypothetical protein
MVAWVKEHQKKFGLTQVDIYKGSGSSITQVFISAFLLGKMHKIDREKWAYLVTFMVGKGAEPPSADVDPAKMLPNTTKLLQEIKALKAATKASWGQIAKMCGLHSTTLHNFQRGHAMHFDTLLQIQEGLRKLKDLPKKLVSAGLLKIVEKRPTPAGRGSGAPPAAPVATVKKTQAKTSIIESAIPSELELDLRELELIGRLRRHHGTPTTLNGSRAGS